MFSDVESLYFDNSDEPDSFLYQLTKDLEEYYKEHPEKGVSYIEMDFENKDAFYNAIMGLTQYTADHVKVYGTSKEGHYELVVEEEEDNDEFTT